MALGAVALFLAALRDQTAPREALPEPPSAASRSDGEASVAEYAGALVGEYANAGAGAEGASHLPQLADVGLRPYGGSLTSAQRPQSQPRRQQNGWPTSARRWRMWELSPLIYLGRISYGLYVFHVLGLMISDYTVHHPDSSLGRYFLRNAVAFLITVALSAISYRWLETPFLTLKQRFTHILSRPGG